MNWIRLILVLLICISPLSSANAGNETADGKLILSKRIWSPIFATIDFDKEKHRVSMTKPEFQTVNEMFYRAYAEYLDQPELVVQQKMYGTSVGKKIAENMVRSLFDLQPFTLTYDKFSQKEKDEWETFSRENYTQVKAIENKMKGLVNSYKVESLRKKLPRLTTRSEKYSNAEA